MNTPSDFSRYLAAVTHKQAASSPAWQRAEGKNEEGGLNAKGRASYNKATGGNLKAPVTEKNPKGKREKRQNSFCARMCGMKRVNTGSKTKSDPDSRINKSLRKWNCKCGSTTETQNMSENEKQAFGPFGIATGIGTVGGLLTGRKKDRVNSAMRGALKGFGTDVGMGLGGALGGAAGMALSRPHMGADGMPASNATTNALIGLLAGTVGGGVLGHSTVSNLIGPYEPEEDKKEEKKMAAFDFGRKLAAVTTCAAPKHNDQSGVDVNPAAAGTPEGKEKLTKKKLPIKAQDVIGKKAETNVSFIERKPKEQKVVRNGGNLNPVAAGEEHEEVEEDTDNDAYEFGKKMAQISAEDHARHQQDLDNWARPRQHRGLTPFENSLVNAAGPATTIIGGALGIPYAGIAGLGLDGMNLATHGIAIADDMARKNRMREYVDGYNKANPTTPLKLPPNIRPRVARPPKPPTTPPANNSNTEGGPQTTNNPQTNVAPTPGKNKTTPPATPATPAASTGSMMDYAPHVVGGLGAAGLAALAYSMMNERKKKKKDDDDLEV